MEWPISWQKVKDNGVYEILDLEDYGVTIDGSSDNILVDGTQMLDDITKIVKSGKTIAIKTNLSALTRENYDLLVPAISYTVNEVGNVNEAIGLARFTVGSMDFPVWVRVYRGSDGNTTTVRWKIDLEIPGVHFYNSLITYVLTAFDGGMSWELGDTLVDLGTVAVNVGNTNNITDPDIIGVLDTYSSYRKNVSARFKYANSSDPGTPLEITLTVELNLTETRDTTSGSTDIAYTASVGGMFFSIYKEGSSWKYTITQQS